MPSPYPLLDCSAHPEASPGRTGGGSCVSGTGCRVECRQRPMQGRWVEPNGAFASNTVGMLHAHSSSYFFVEGQGSWLNADTLGVAHAPGYWATPTNHGFGISKTSRNPDLAWAFVKHLTGNRWAIEYSRRRKLLTGNIAADTQGLELMRKEDPLAAQMQQTQLEHTDKFCGDWTSSRRCANQGCFLSGDPECNIRSQRCAAPSATLSARSIAY
jgi:hypothetical protein